MSNITYKTVCPPQPTTMDEITLPYRYADGDDDIVTEYETVRIDHDSEEISLGFGPVGADSGRTVEAYIEEPAYLDDPESDVIARRLPELDELADLAREEILDALTKEAPAEYWEQPASGSGKHHPPDERGVHGQWIHTKRMLRNYESIARSGEEMDRLRGRENDGDIWTEDDLAYSMDDEDIRYGRMAALVHDIHKFGEDGTEETARSDHDVTAAEYVREQTDLPDPVADAVEAHNGPWYDGKIPEDDTEAAVHIADMIAADTASETLLQEPTPALKFAQIIDDVLRYDDGLEAYTLRFDG